MKTKKKTKKTTVKQCSIEKLQQLMFLVGVLSDELKTAAARGVVLIDDDYGEVDELPICEHGASWLIDKRDEIENIRNKLLTLMYGS